jgi:hypothetical protein
MIMRYLTVAVAAIAALAFASAASAACPGHSQSVKAPQEVVQSTVPSTTTTKTDEKG